MPGPFDDPEVRRLMRENGVVHKPGLADGLLHELGPLLAEEGFDVDSLDATDLETMNKALSRAVERHNFELFVPVGKARLMALTTLRLVAETINDGDLAAAEGLIQSIKPEPDADSCSVAHVIGVSTGILDTWHTDLRLRQTLQATRVPAWEKLGRAAAIDILALAHKGRAFDAMVGLHVRHSGLNLLYGGILTVTGTLQAWAAHDKTTVTEIAGRVLISES